MTQLVEDWIDRLPNPSKEISVAEAATWEPLLHPTAKARWRSRSVAAGNSLPKGLRALRVPQPSLSCKLNKDLNVEI